MLTSFPDPSIKSAKMSKTLSRMLYSHDRFHVNKILQLALGLSIGVAKLVEIAQIY